MRFERSQLRRAAAAAVAASLVLVASACGGDDEGGGGGTSTALEGKGPITFATGKDTSGFLPAQVAAWNSAHPDEKVTVVELPESADAQRQQMVQAAQNKQDSFSVLNLDVVWTAEFAANKWVVELPRDQFPSLTEAIPATVKTAEYRGKLYAVPITSDGGLMYYRKDLLDKAGVQAPTTWADMQAACQKVQALPEGKGLNCYAGQYEKYEGLTVNFSEAVNGAGGVVVGEDGKPNVDTPEALAGLEFLVNGFKSGEIAKAAITYKEEEGRRAFQDGKLMISPSVDGQAPSMLAALYGAHVVRGSGSYTGVRAVRGVHQAIVKEGISPGITPDGPRGPRFKFKPGAIFTAQIAGKAVVPLAYAAKPAWVLKTWDKFVIPPPFAKVCIAIGEPYFPPEKLDDEQMQAAQRELERRMLETYEQARSGLRMADSG